MSCNTDQHVPVALGQFIAIQTNTYQWHWASSSQYRPTRTSGTGPVHRNTDQHVPVALGQFIIAIQTNTYQWHWASSSQYRPTRTSGTGPVHLLSEVGLNPVCNAGLCHPINDVQCSYQPELLEQKYTMPRE